MSISKKLLNKLDESKAKYEVVEHRKVFTAFDAAATLKVKLDQVVKSLLVKAGKDYYLALLPANKNLNFKKLAKVLNVDVKKVAIPKEKVMTEKFKVKPGAMSAFGSLYKIPVVVDNSLIKVKEAVFSSGSFVESIKMKVKDYLTLENPVTGNFSVVKKIKLSASHRPKKAKSQKPKAKAKKTTKKPARKKKKS